MNTPLRAAALVLTSALLSNCSSPPRDAASEAPVQLTPGNYHVTWLGTGIGALRNEHSDSLNDDVCLRASKAETFPRDLAKSYLAIGSERNCTSRSSERHGNAIGGRISCRVVDPKYGGGSMGAEYQGTLSGDRVELRATLKMDLPRSGMDPAEAQQREMMAGMVDGLQVNVTAERTGDCQ